MSGGPSQLDTFDPKPAIARYQGQRPSEVEIRTERTTGGLYPSPFRFRRGGQSGIFVSDLLPRIRESIDDICVIRSMHTFSPNHEPAVNFMASGRIDASHPTLGAWTSYGLGSENDDLPAFVALGSVDRRLVRNGYLPGEHQGTPILVNSSNPEKMIPNLRNGQWDPCQQAAQLKFLRQLNSEHLGHRGPDAMLEARMRAVATAARMQTTAAEVFDLSHEPQHVRRLYGTGTFADTCLLARRLVEHGVRFIQIDHGNWDHHTDINVRIPSLCKAMDQPVAGLIQDLKQRGLFEDTLIIWGGEFGRTPVSESQDGRDHNSYGFTMWLAGGGVRGGTVHGATDEFGFRAVEDRVSVHDLHATVLYLLGVDHKQLTFRYSGRDFRLTDVHGNVVTQVLS